ncbi:cell cycle checkpoint control protein RAD9A isoform X2 [Centruroides vittatus]|uniref:cell cycle checkpoint control protein RAD9A isoform X2 n=1 Tax=Centruroides vittatus TaxID=120091 RepID=UPI00350F2621
MKCDIQCSGVKVLGKAVHALSRIGDEIYLETSKDGSLLIAFKSSTMIEKTIDTCSLELNNHYDNFIINNYCKHDLIKSYHLHLIENEALEEIFEKSDYKNKILAQSRMILKSIQNFHATVEEITLILNDEKVVMKNYVDDEPDPNQVIHTELSFEKEEFELYQLETEIVITFCLKELRAVVNFAESCNVPILICIQASGVPILFELQEIPGVEAEFALATLSEETGSQTSTSIRQSNNSSVALPQDSDLKENVNRCVALSITDDNSDMSPTMIENASADPVAVEAAEENVVPSTPPHKKLRRMFLGLSSSSSQSSRYTSVIPDPDEVLAEASDED